MESWRMVWRNGYIPFLIEASGQLNAILTLQTLLTSLENDDPRLIQGGTTTPPPLMCVRDWPVEAACLLGFCGWMAQDLDTVGNVEEFFARTCFEIDRLMGEEASSRYLINYWDETPRDKARSEMIAEVKHNLQVLMMVPGVDPNFVPETTYTPREEEIPVLNCPF